MRFFGDRSDAELVRRTLQGQNDSFEVLVRRHLPMAEAITAARVGNRHDIEEIVQDSFIKAYTALNSLHDARKFAGWLAAIVRNLCANFHRAQQVRQSVPIDHAHSASVTPAFEKDELARLLRVRLDELDEDSREILLLHYFAGKRVAEIAALLDLSNDAVKKRMQRARAALGRELLRDLEPDTSARRTRDDRARNVMGAIPVAAVPWAKGGAVVGASVAMNWSFASVMAVLVAGVAAFGSASLAVGGCDGQSEKNIPQFALEDIPEPASTAPNSAGSNSDSNSPLSNEKESSRRAVAGRAYFVGTNEPLADAEIRLVDPHSTTAFAPLPQGARSTRTNQDGKFQFVNVEPGSYLATLVDSRGHAEPFAALVDNSAYDLWGELQVRTGASIAGRVYDAATGQGVAGVEVYGEVGPRTTSGKDGRYILRGVPIGERQIRRGVTADYAYLRWGEEKRVQISTDDTSIADIDFPLTPGLCIAGRIVDGEQNARPLFPLRFGLMNVGMSLDVVSDKDGNFEVRNMPQQWGAWYSLFADDVQRGLALPEGNLTIELQSFDVRDLVVMVQPAATVSGVVVTPTGSAVAGATVLLTLAGSTSSISPQTDAGGKFTATAYPGEYTIALDPPVADGGSRSFKRDLDVLTLAPGENRSGLRYVYDASEGMSIAGRIVDSEGRPLPGVSFFIYKGDGTGTVGQSDPNGDFVVTGLEDDLYSLTYFQFGRTTYYDGVQAAAGRQDVEVRLDLELEPETPEFRGEPITGVVTNKTTGKPVTSFAFALRPGVYDVLEPGANYTNFWGSVGWPLTDQVTSQEGKFQAPTYTDGEHTLLVMAVGYAPHFSAAAAGSTVSIALEPGAGIQGVVLDSQGAPVEGVRIQRGGFEGLPTDDHMTRRGDANLLAVSDGEGRFRINDLPSTAEEYTALHPAHGVITQTISATIQNPVDVVFQFPETGELEGSISIDGIVSERAGITVSRDDKFIGNTWSDKNGAFKLSGLPLGKYQIGIQAGPAYGGRVPLWLKTMDATVTGGDAQSLNVDFPPALSSLSGIATVDGVPITAIASVHIEYPGTGITGTVDVDLGADGSFAIEKLFAGQATIQFPDTWEGIEFDRNTIEVVLPEGEAVRQDIVLQAK